MKFVSETYDEISLKYQQSESVSKRKDIIKDRFEEFLESNKPQSVLDLGCGTGVFAIIAKQAGVSKVVGIDISPVQIKIAKEKAESLGLEIEYVVQDIASFNIQERFDVISSIFGFCYASSHQILREQLVSTFTHLKTSGDIFAVVPNPQHPTRDWGESYRVYAQGQIADGTKLQCDFLLDGKVVATDYKFYWSKKIWEDAVKDVGFIDVIWEELDEHSTNIVLKAGK